MTYKEYINKQIKTGIHYYQFIPAFVLILGVIGISVTKNGWFYGVIAFSLFGLPQVLKWNLRKTLKCPVCQTKFTDHIETKMIHWNKNTFEWNSCPECKTDFNEIMYNHQSETRN